MSEETENQNNKKITLIQADQFNTNQKVALQHARINDALKSVNHTRESDGAKSEFKIAST
jgi:AAA15 family ATPase/GTPase